MSSVHGDDTGLDSLRIDRWLWAARVYKTRSAASEACGAGHVKIDGVSVKPSKGLHRGTRVEAITPGGPRILEVVGLQSKRGPAPAARTLYVDHTPPPPPREQRPAQIERIAGEGRPSKRDRRQLKRLRGY